MKQYLELNIKNPENNNLDKIVYTPNSLGKIELRKVSENLSTLIIFFENLFLVEDKFNDSIDEILDNPISIMLANYPVNTNNLSDIELELKDGWTDEKYFTMITFRDGESINNNKIRIKKDNEGRYDIFWTGSFSKWQKDYFDRFLELRIKAVADIEVITPLCE